MKLSIKQVPTKNKLIERGQLVWPKRKILEFFEGTKEKFNNLLHVMDKSKCNSI